MDYICLDCETVYTPHHNYSRHFLVTLVVDERCPDCGGRIGVMVDHD